jgi:ABC-type polar amino acid transport system ATPase subunit
MKFGRDVADRVIMMDHGQIVEEAAPDQLFTNPQSDRTRAFLRDILDR